MKKQVAVLLALVLSSLILFPVLFSPAVYAEDGPYYNETVLSDGCRIVYLERIPMAAPRVGSFYLYDRCGVLGPDGSFVVEPVYQKIEAPVDGRARFRDADGLYGFFDENWTVVTSALYRNAELYSEGLASVTDQQRRVGYIDRDGKTVIPFLYSYGEPFRNGSASVGIAEQGYNMNEFTRFGRIDRNGTVVEPLRFRFDQTTFPILMSENRIDINGTVYENDSLSWPFINYLGYSYIPLTWGTCRALGFSCSWSPETGLVLTEETDLCAPETGANPMRHGVYDKATLYPGFLTINGKAYTSDDFYYPLLFYRDIVYLPVLYREGMERLGIRYSYHLGEGDTTPGYMVFTKR